MKIINGGVTAPKGFKAAGIHCGVKENSGDKKDLAIIKSDVMCSAAGVFTTNKVKAAPVYLTKANVSNGKAIAVVVNSGNANACAPKGRENALKMSEEAAKALGVDAEDMIVASTGVIGHEINIGALVKGIPEAVAKLSDSEQASEDAAHAIMTTDLAMKQTGVEIELSGKTVRVGGISKGSGMIHPNMGTMLCFITTDAAIDSKLLQKMLLESVKVTFNRVSVDGDTSTNDTCCVLANGMAQNPVINAENEDYEILKQAIHYVCRTLAIKMAKDGEGATKLITCTVKGAESEAKAETLSMSVIKSPLLKAAMFGADANWGRVLCAMGYSGAEFDPSKVSVTFSSRTGSIDVYKDGAAIVFDEEKAKQILSVDEVEINISMAEGEAEVTAWGCDLTYDYVRINGDYRS